MKTAPRAPRRCNSEARGATHLVLGQRLRHGSALVRLAVALDDAHVLHGHHDAAPFPGLAIADVALPRDAGGPRQHHLLGHVVEVHCVGRAGVAVLRVPRGWLTGQTLRSRGAPRCAVGGADGCPLCEHADDGRGEGYRRAPKERETAGRGVSQPEAAGCGARSAAALHGFLQPAAAVPRCMSVARAIVPLHGSAGGQRCSGGPRPTGRPPSGLWRRARATIVGERALRANGALSKRGPLAPGTGRGLNPAAAGCWCRRRGGARACIAGCAPPLTLHGSGGPSNGGPFRVDWPRMGGSAARAGVLARARGAPPIGRAHPRGGKGKNWGLQ